MGNRGNYNREGKRERESGRGDPRQGKGLSGQSRIPQWVPMSCLLQVGGKVVVVLERGVGV